MNINQLIVDNNNPGNINGGRGDDVIVGDIGGTVTNVEPGKNYNVALIVDTSGSMDEMSGQTRTETYTETEWVQAGCGGYFRDVEKTREVPVSRMEIVKEALVNLVGQLSEHDGTINVSLIGFATTASTPITIKNLNADNIDTLLTAIDALSADGGTNYEAAFHQAVQWFNGPDATAITADNNYENLTFFLTDGDPTFYVDNEGETRGPGSRTDYDTLKNAVDAFDPLSNISIVHGIGIGNGVNVDYLRFFDNTDSTGMYSVTFGSGKTKKTVTGPSGSVDIVNTADDLGAALEGRSESTELIDLADDSLMGGDGNDLIFADTINTDHLEWTNGGTGESFMQGSHDGMGYQGLVQYLKWAVNNGVNPDSGQLIDYIRNNYVSLIDTLHEDGGSDTLDGGRGDDILISGSGEDLVIGGEGSDILYGGAGADIFKWSLGDEGDEGAAVTDTVMDFNANEGDVLDLSDLLQNREGGDLSDFVRASDDGQGGTVIHISTTGRFAGDNLSAADQLIQLTGVQYDSQIVSQLIQEGRIQVDQ